MAATQTAKPPVGSVPYVRRSPMGTKTIDQISNHLEFLGYTVAHEGNITSAKHNSRLGILMKPLGGGILFTTIFGGADHAKRDRIGYLELVNSLNNQAAVARFYADKDSDFIIEAWHPDAYDRTAFGVFMETWNRDCALLAESDAVKYLR
jgi:hypothetical protein